MELKDITLKSSYKERYLQYLQGRSQASMLIKDSTKPDEKEEVINMDNTNFDMML